MLVRDGGGSPAGRAGGRTAGLVVPRGTVGIAPCIRGCARVGSAWAIATFTTFTMFDARAAFDAIVGKPLAGRSRRAFAAVGAGTLDRAADFPVAARRATKRAF
jgi:hypothetical protein